MTRVLLISLVLFGMADQASAQDAVKDVQKAIDAGRQAAIAKDATAYAAVLADDLRWINGADGTVQTKQDRLKALGGTPPAWTDIEIKVVGDTAVVTWVQANAQTKQRSRGARTYIRRDGRWQLLVHAVTPLK